MSPARFNRPPLDGSLTITELYDWHYLNNRDHPLFVFEDAPGTLRTITMGEGVQGMHRATSYVLKEINLKGVLEKPAVIAILSTSDSITLFCTILGTMRTTNTVFPVSPRESPEALAFLFSRGKADYVIVSPEPAVQKLAEAAIALSEKQHQPKKLDMPTYQQLFPSNGFDPDFPSVPAVKNDMDAVAAILHSSGTTSFPKPVYWQHRAFISIATIPMYGELDFTGKVVANHCVPIFHGMGMLPLTMPAATGMVISVFRPQNPAIAPNPTNVFQGAISTKSEYILVPPVFLEAWSQNSNYVEALARMEGVIYGGGPLDKGAGDLLASQGVNLFVSYACVQTAMLSEFLPKPVGMGWEYFRMSLDRPIHLKDHGNNEFEVIVLADKNYRPNAINTEIEGVAAYATSDLVTPHPTKKDFYKVIGRTDDQIIHSTSEKTNPGPLESILAQDPLIESAVIFGRGRPQCGVIVQPSQSNAFDPSDTEKLIQYRKAIWPTVEKANARAATHSRIFIEMILVASPSKLFEYTSKGNLRRQRMIDAYANEINDLYASVAESAQEDIPGPPQWTLEETTQFVKSVIGRTLKTRSTSIDENADLFEHGLDSLQATWIRNTIIRVLRNYKVELANRLSISFVYEHPTTASLTEYVAGIASGKGQVNGHSADAKKEELRALVAKYSHSFPVSNMGEKVQDGVVVLLTGATGAFGSNILAALLSNPEVLRVYVISRTGSDALVQDRIIAAFRREGLNEELLQSSKLELFEGDLNKPDFSLPEYTFTRLRGTTTHIIHNAWRVDFNLAVSSFEANIKSVRSLIDFALNGGGFLPARLLFVSSIGVYINYHGTGAAPEKLLDEPDACIGGGYGESKWVAEQILKSASEEAVEEPLKAIVVRPGQMTGGPSGAWNEKEWFPTLIKSSVHLGKLPAVHGDVTWVTSDVAASVLLDMLLNSKEPVMHLVHSRPVPWVTVINAFAEELKLPVVSYDEWLSALEESASALDSASQDQAEVEKQLEQNPALRLLSFFRGAKSRTGEDVEPLGVPKLASENAQKSSEALRDARQISGEDVKRWVRYWRSTGFIPGEQATKGIKRSIDQL